MTDKLRIGFIGAGGIARGHAQRLTAMPEVELVALADPNEAMVAELVKAAPAAATARVFADYREMLDRVPLDAVSINTPHTQHFGQGMDALGRGLHVLMEKPLVCCVPDAKALIAAAQGKVLMVSYQRHFSGQYVYMREQLAGGALGNLQFVAALQSQDWLRSQKGKWRQLKSLAGGGQINDSGSHLIDVLLWTTGLVAESVFATMENFGSEVDINSALTMRFTNGAQGTMSIIGDSPMYWEEFSVWGERGVMLFRNGKLLQRMWGESEMREVTEFAPNSNPDQNFVDAILGRDEVRVPPECGLHVIELTEAAWKSAELGREVKVYELG